MMTQDFINTVFENKSILSLKKNTNFSSKYLLLYGHCLLVIWLKSGASGNDLFVLFQFQKNPFIFIFSICSHIMVIGDMMQMVMVMTMVMMMMMMTCIFLFSCGIVQGQGLKGRQLIHHKESNASTAFNHFHF